MRYTILLSLLALSACDGPDKANSWEVPGIERACQYDTAKAVASISNPGDRYIAQDKLMTTCRETHGI